MESSSLRQLLKSLCCNTQWKYAVFWKLKPGSPMLLSWEDGYCDYPKARDSGQDLPDNIHFNYTTRITLPGCGFDGNSGSQLAYSIGLAVTNMSSLLYTYGEGVVGIVASTGRHSWAFANELKYNTLFDSPDEWQVQFAVGIQTVLLVPVVPHGVVQLGALEMVPEDLTVVAHIKGLFTLHHASRLSSLSAIRDILDPLSSFFSPIFEDLSPSSAATTNLTNLALDIPLTKDLAVLDSDQVKFNIPTTLGYHQPPLFPNRENIHAFVNQLMSDDLLEITEDSLPNFSGYENVTHYNDVNQQLLGELFPLMNSWEQDVELSNTHNAHMDAYKFCSFEPVMAQHVGGVVDGKIKDKVMTSSLSFSIDSELHEALGPAFNSYNTNVPETAISVEDRCSNLSMIFQTDVTENMNENSMECLLDAVVGNICVVSDEKVLNRCNGFSPSSSSGFATSCQTQSRSQCDVKSELLPIRSNLRSSLTPSSSRGTSSLINEGEQKMDLGYAQSKKSLKSYQIRGRKGRVDVNRPRPRDRQMIQDRVKDLREIVPNGAKCSIDALLERTIKHTLFLESITNRAEKLRNCSHFKAASSENWNGFKSHQNDGSWAYGLGGQHGFFPINVENLDQPGQMIVEMLCEEYGLFLEIAQVIKRLKLTILKGVMENRSNKTWAHFIVETYKGFQRMDMLWPLMQLLQRDHNPIVSKF